MLRSFIRPGPECTEKRQDGDSAIFVQQGPRQATCSPNESLIISGSASSQTPKVNFCLFSPSPFGDLKRIVGVIIYSCHCVYSPASTRDVRGNGAACADGVKADNYPLLALFFFSHGLNRLC